MAKIRQGSTATASTFMVYSEVLQTILASL